MIEKCFEEGVIQSFLDGELVPEMVERFSRHVSMCDSCAEAVAEAEAEIEFAFAALDSEDNDLVPTQRLWTKINYSIEADARNRSVWQSVLAFLSTPSAVGFASLVIVFGLFIGLYGLKNGSNKNVVSVSTSPGTNAQAVNLASRTAPSAAQIDEDTSSPAQPGPLATETGDDREIRPITSDFVRRERISDSGSNRNAGDIRRPSATLLAEESYMKTISTLENTVNSRKDEVMNSAARFSFERDIAVANEAIRIMKEEVRKNPNNEAARILLRSSYQNKIDLLNSVTEKTELIASLN